METEIDRIAEITNGNSGIIGLLRTPRHDEQHLQWTEEFVTVETSIHLELPLSLDCYKGETNINSFMKQISITKKQKDAVEAATQDQSNNDKWY